MLLVLLEPLVDALSSALVLSQIDRDLDSSCHDVDIYMISGNLEHFESTSREDCFCGNLSIPGKV